MCGFSILPSHFQSAHPTAAFFCKVAFVALSIVALVLAMKWIEKSKNLGEKCCAGASVGTSSAVSVLLIIGEIKKAHREKKMAEGQLKLSLEMKKIEAREASTDELQKSQKGLGFLSKLQKCHLEKIQIAANSDSQGLKNKGTPRTASSLAGILHASSTLHLEVEPDLDQVLLAEPDDAVDELP